MNAWMTAEERVPPKTWAWRIAKQVSWSELRELAAALDPVVLQGEDRSRPSLKRRRDPLKNSLADDLAHRGQVRVGLDRPFGKKVA